MKAPCRECGDRKVGCHARCKKYLEFAKANKELAKKRRLEIMKYRMSMKCEDWLNKEVKRKQRGY